MDVRVGLWRKLSAEELMLLNCGVGEDSWGSLGRKEIQPVHFKGDQSWVFFGRTDAKAETPVLWPPQAKSWLLEKTLMLGGIGGRRRRGRQRMRWLDAITNLIDMSLSELRGVGDGQGGLACCDSWGCKESDTTERLNWTELNWTHLKGFPCSSVGKGSACSAGDPGSIPGLGRFPGEGNGNPLQYPCLENLRDRGAWWATAHRVAKSRVWLSD